MKNDDYPGGVIKPQENETTTVAGKGGKARHCVYIGSETHRILTAFCKIIDVNGQDISVGAYADMIIWDFLQKHKEKINEIYRSDPGDLF